MKANYLMLKMPLLPSEYSSHEILFFLTSCCTVNTIFKCLQSISLREEEGKQMNFWVWSSICLQFWSRKGEIRKKSERKKERPYMKKIDSVVSVGPSTFSCWLELSDSLKRKIQCTIEMQNCRSYQYSSRDSFNAAEPLGSSCLSTVFPKAEYLI